MQRTRPRLRLHTYRTNKRDVCCTWEKSSEENISTQEYCQETSPWLQSTHEDERWSFGLETTTGKRTEAVNRLREIRNPNIEIRNNIKRLKRGVLRVIRNFGFGLFDFVSSFEFRIFPMGVCLPRFGNMNESGIKVILNVYMRRGKRWCLLLLSYT